MDIRADTAARHPHIIEQLATAGGAETFRLALPAELVPLSLRTAAVAIALAALPATGDGRVLIDD